MGLWSSFKKKVSNAYDRVKNNATNPVALLNAPVTGGASLLLGDDERSHNIQYSILGGQALVGAGGLAYGFATGAPIASSIFGSPYAPSAYFGTGVSAKSGLTALGMAASLGTSAYTDYKNYKLQKEYAEKNYELQKEQFNYQKWLNENQVGLNLSQYQKAGINPMAASSNTFSAGAGLSPINAPQIGDSQSRIADFIAQRKMQDRDLQNQRDIVSSQNATQLYGFNKQSDTELNKVKIQEEGISDRQKRQLEQDRFLKLSELTMNNKHFTYEQKKDILKTIASIQQNNQLTRVDYQNKVEDLKHKIADTFELFKNGHVTKQGFFNNLLSYMEDLGLKSDNLSREKAKNFLDFLEEEEKGSTTYKEFESNVMKYVLNNIIPDYEDVSVDRLEELLKKYE